MICKVHRLLVQYILPIYQVFLFGVDLGAKDLTNIRAKGAVGSTPRDLNERIEGNFGGICFTDRYLMDARFVFERIASQFRELSIELFNCSDGAMIPGWMPLSPEKAQSVHISNENLLKSKFFSWWKTCTSYSQEMLISRNCNLDIEFNVHICLNYSTL